MSDNIITGSIKVHMQAPLESKRGPVRVQSDLYNIDTWEHEKYIDHEGKEQIIVYAYPGMIVPVIETKEIWMLLDPEKITSASGWTMINGGGGGANIIYDGGRADEKYIAAQYMDSGDANQGIK